MFVVKVCPVVTKLADVAKTPVSASVTKVPDSKNSTAFPAELTASNLLAVKAPGVSLNPTNVELPPPPPALTPENIKPSLAAFTTTDWPTAPKLPGVSSKSRKFTAKSPVMDVSTKLPVSESSVATPLNVSILESNVLPVEERLDVNVDISESLLVICVCSVWPVVTKLEVRVVISLSLEVIWVCRVWPVVTKLLVIVDISESLEVICD